MRDDTIRALARANRYLWGLLEADGELMTDVRFGNYQRRPAMGLAELQREVMSHNLMTEEVTEMMSALVDDIDSDDVSSTAVLNAAQQGTYILEWHFQRDFRVVSVKTAADMLGVSTQRVYALLSEGKLRGVTLSGRRMVYRFTVERRIGAKDDA